MVKPGRISLSCDRIERHCGTKFELAQVKRGKMKDDHRDDDDTQDQIDDRMFKRFKGRTDPLEVAEHFFVLSNSGKNYPTHAFPGM